MNISDVVVVMDFGEKIMEAASKNVTKVILVPGFMLFYLGYDLRKKRKLSGHISFYDF